MLVSTFQSVWQWANLEPNTSRDKFNAVISVTYMPLFFQTNPGQWTSFCGICILASIFRDRLPPPSNFFSIIGQLLYSTIPKLNGAK